MNAFLLDEQLQTHWPRVLDAYQRRVNPLHPGFLGKLSNLRYNWTVHQSEWATDRAFVYRQELMRWMPLWQRQALNYPSTEILRFLGREVACRATTPGKLKPSTRAFTRACA